MNISDISPFFWDRKNKNPNFNFKFSVKKSTIEVAGYGLFAEEDIPENSILISKHFISVDDYIKLATTNYDISTLIEYSIKIQNENDIEKLIHYFNTFKKYSIEEIKYYLSMLISGGVTLSLYINSYSHHLNHSNNYNIVMEKKNKICYKTINNIKKGEEIFMTYKQFNFY